MNIRSLFRFIVTLGPIGYSPAPGTTATLVTLPFVWSLHHLVPLVSTQFVLISLFFFFSMYVLTRALQSFDGIKDPSEIVIDEVLGCFITFSAVSLNWVTVVIGFLLFRLIDIYKWFGIKKIERISGAWGIMLDDIAAGFCANIFLHGIWFIINYVIDCIIIWA